MLGVDWNAQAAYASGVCGWIADGRVKWEETVMDGIESAPAAFLGLFTGGNTGKMVVKL